MPHLFTEIEIIGDDDTIEAGIEHMLDGLADKAGRRGLRLIDLLVLGAAAAAERHSGMTEDMFLAAYRLLSAELAAGGEISIDEQARRIGLPSLYMRGIRGLIVRAGRRETDGRPN